VRHACWVFEPRAGTLRLTEEQMRTLPRDYLADELRRRVVAGPMEFDMVLQFPEPGDDVTNPPWPGPTTGRVQRWGG
jgi:catalase